MKTSEQSTQRLQVILVQLAPRPALSKLLSIPVIDVATMSDLNAVENQFSASDERVVIIDARLLTEQAITKLQRLRTVRPETPILLLADDEHETIALQQLSIRLVDDYLLSEQLTSAELARALRQARRLRRLTTECRRLGEQVTGMEADLEQRAQEIGELRAALLENDQDVRPITATAGSQRAVTERGVHALRDLASEVLREARQLADQCGVRFVASGHASLPSVFCDPNQLRNTWSELLRGSIESCPPSDVVRARVETSPEGDAVVIRICGGMAPSMTRRISLQAMMESNFGALQFGRDAGVTACSLRVPRFDVEALFEAYLNRRASHRSSQEQITLVQIQRKGGLTSAEVHATLAASELACPLDDGRWLVAMVADQTQAIARIEALQAACLQRGSAAHVVVTRLGAWSAIRQPQEIMLHVQMLVELARRGVNAEKRILVLDEGNRTTQRLVARLLAAGYQATAVDHQTSAIDSADAVVVTTDEAEPPRKAGDSAIIRLSISARERQAKLEQDAGLVRDDVGRESPKSATMAEPSWQAVNRHGPNALQTAYETVIAKTIPTDR